VTRLPVGVLTAVVLGTGCSQLPGIGGNPASPATAASPLPTLDAPIPTPAGFPAEVPIYPRSRLTAGASFASGGLVTWGMEWETTDDAGKVTAFFSKQLGAGGWTLTPSSQSNGAVFAGSFSRNGNPGEKGTLAIASQSGVTTIALSLVTSG